MRISKFPSKSLRSSNGTFIKDNFDSCLFVYVYVFVLRERKKEGEGEGEGENKQGRGRERKRESQAGSMLSTQKPANHEIMT